MTEKLAYSRREAAHALSISVALLQREIDEGRIAARRIGARVVVPRWSLEARLQPERGSAC